MTFVLLANAQARNLSSSGSLHICLEREESQHRRNVNRPKLVSEFLPDTFILSEDLQGYYQRQSAVTSGVQNLEGRPREEHAGHKDVGVQNNSHLLLLTFETTIAMSDRFMPLARACCRPLQMRRSKLPMDGGVMAFKITTSPSPTTTN
jgi:hypothetical protein